VGKLSYIAAPLDQAASRFLYDHFRVLQPNFRPPGNITVLLSCLVGKVLDEEILHGEACVNVHALHGDSLHALVLKKEERKTNYSLLFFK
jgi:hypothetical protein